MAIIMKNASVSDGSISMYLFRLWELSFGYEYEHYFR